jgi:hypothetical protein
LGGWVEIEIKAKLSPAEAGVWAVLGNMQLKYIHTNKLLNGFDISYTTVTFKVLIVCM